METPVTLLNAIRVWSDPETAQQYFANLRWPNGVACPRSGCGSAEVRYIGGKRPRWLCRECNRQFTAKLGTIFEDSPIGFDKWLPAIWLISANRNGISSCELARALGVTQKTAWFMLHRVRLAMQSKTWERLSGEVEADETFVGGKLSHSKEARRRSRKGIPWDPNFNKTRVLGAVQRGGEVRAWAVPNLKRDTMLPKLQESIRPDAVLYTDGSNVLYSIGKKFSLHKWINHALKYVEGEIHTNNIECFWSVLKRTIGGTYIHVNPRHLDRYLAEQVFRFNERENVDASRFERAAKGADQKRLTYRELIAK
jgi:transposase-like protein